MVSNDALNAVYDGYLMAFDAGRIQEAVEDLEAKAEAFDDMESEDAVTDAAYLLKEGAGPDEYKDHMEDIGV